MKRLYLVATLMLAGCGAGEDVVTLYRTSVVTEGARIHVATFDSADGVIYNRDNCETARGLFQAQAGVRTRFWCEDGRFHD